jgi:hypothetical protein
MTDEECFMHLRHLLEAIKLVGDAIKEDSEHVTNALYDIVRAMRRHIEALERRL